MIAYVVIGLVAAQRLAELLLARRNTTALKARGAVEIGAGHYPLIVALHAGWLAAIVVFLPDPAAVSGWLLALYVLVQGLRLWTVSSLGPYWTTRIITLPGAPLVRRGPYRFLRHPNYVVVTLEIAILPLALGEVVVALVFTLLNAAALAWRIRQEEVALASRRAL